MKIKIKKRGKKKRQSDLAKLKKRLAQLQSGIATATSDATKNKLILQVFDVEAKIKIENFHKITGFNRIRGYEIPSGAPGLGKRS